MDLEQKWIRDIQKHDSRPAAERLVERYYDEIYRFVYRQLGNKEDAMDLTQNIFLAVFRALPGYDRKKAAFRTWLYRIAVNKVIDLRRRVQPVQLPLEDLDFPDPEDYPARIQDRALLEQIEQYVSGLDPGLQSVFRLRLYGEYTFPEIAAALGQSESAVKSQYHCLLRNLRTKVLAGITAAMALYLLLAVLSFAVFFVLWDWSGVWNASMASQFNNGIFSQSDINYDSYRPFIPWADFTAGSYLLAMIALGAALTVVFTLLTAIFGVLIGNAYASALAMVIFVIASWAVWYTSYMQDCWAVFAPLSFLPASLWDQTLGWFTDGGIMYFTPWQETVTTALWLVLGGSGTALALRRFNRKDVRI